MTTLFSNIYRYWSVDITMNDNPEDANPEEAALEAEPFAFIELQIEQAPGIVTISKVHFGTNTAIFGLKEDISHLVGIEATQQMWFYEGVLLEDEKSLQDYGIGGKPTTFITVKRLH